MFSHQVNPLNTDKNLCPHLNDGLDVPRKPPEPCWHIGKLQLWGAFQELLQELLVLAIEQGLLGAVVHVEDLEEDAEDDGNYDEVEHVGRLDSHCVSTSIFPGQNALNPVPIWAQNCP